METQRFDSRLMRGLSGARAVPRIVALLGIIFAAGVGVAAQGGAQGDAPPRAAERKPEAKEPAQGFVEGAEVDVKVFVAGTPEDPHLLARIGEFPEDLGELGKEFLKREFIEHFIRDVMGLGGRKTPQAIKIALLPQEDAREQECSFNTGEISGRITVRLAERYVFVLVSLDRGQEAAPTLRAATATVKKIEPRS